jgi:HEPN domain-containing protein
MKAITAEWVAKAEGDLSAGLLLLRSRKSPNYDAACFHAQQSAEKYLKGILQEEGVAFPKTHALESLLDLLPARDAAWEGLRPSLVNLSEAAVGYRYPRHTADKAAAKRALATARQVRSLARQRLHLRK